MAQLDANSQDGKGWSFIKEGSIQALKNFARKQNDADAVYRIFEDGLCALVGRTRNNGRMEWGEGNKNPRELMHLGTDSTPKRCKCGSKAKPVIYKETSHHYEIQCESESCPALSVSTHSVSVIDSWNKL